MSGSLKMKKNHLIQFILIFLVCLVLSSTAIAKNQIFVSIEPHLGYGNSKYFYVGGKIYNYKGLEWTRKPYYGRPNLELIYKNKVVEFKPDSEGYFWLDVPIKENTELKYGIDNLNYVSVKLDKTQKKKNKKLKLVTNYGFNAENIYIPFMIPDQNAKFGIVSDFDDTITKIQGLGLIEQITNDPKKFVIRENLAKAYTLLQNQINPIFYVTARPNGTYNVIEEVLKIHKFPTGPILPRNLGFWFFDKGQTTKEHKIEEISRIMETYPALSFILIGDASDTDPKIYFKILNKYPERIIKIFIFNKKRTPLRYSEYVKVVKEADEIVEEMINLGYIEKQEN
jgi:hypothetical protein